MAEYETDNTHTFVVLTRGVAVGHYRIIEKIGAGGMGEVYLAEDTKLNRKVALKFLPAHLSEDDDMKARFRREAQAAAKLDHPNIVPIYEVGEFQNRPFIAMAHIEGVSLRDTIDNGKLSIAQCITLTAQICDGLKLAHDSGVVHRDVKPGNIIIDSSGRPRLLDFGLATIEGTDNITKAGSTIGTLGYMAPEQIKGEEADARSDLFSVGVILYEMITRENPFRRSNGAATMNSILNDMPKPLRSYVPGTPDEVQSIVSRLLEKDRSKRTGSTSELLNYISRIGALKTDEFDELIGEADRRKMLAVMPFENLGPPEEEYFADGMTEEIINRLATIKELGVISRTSTMTYKQTVKSMREIGHELGVDFVLEGSIRWNRRGKDADRVRITSQLIRVSDDTNLWSDRYDRTLDDIFEVQSQIADHVVKQLNIRLLGSQLNVLQAKPTEDIDAYQYYLRGLEYAGRPDYAMQDFKNAQEMFERAIELDPEFALAQADLSRTHSLLYFHGYDRSNDCVSNAKAAADRAHTLKPDLAEVHLAYGYYYYYCKHDLESAFAELERLRHFLPNDSRVLSLTGAIVKRQGKYSDAVEYYKRAFEISPRDASLPHEIGCAYMTMREYSKAERYYNLSISLANRQVAVYVCKAWNEYLWKGDVNRGKEALTRFPEGGEPDLFELSRAHLFAGEYHEALKILTAAPEIYDVGQWLLMPKSQFEALIYQLMGDDENARLRYDAAREFLEAELKDRPQDDRVLSSLANVYAGLGQAEEAISAAKLAIELMPVKENAVVGPFRIEDLAFTYTLLGEFDAAIDRLDYLLSIPSWMSVTSLRIDPRWQPLQDHPKFKELLTKYEA
jgi:serine/threonine protein kinase/tetratricopeptide (TPR) repeat protein